ncbi:uncharacterized protein Dvir_GJ11994 [Drosophila virilis]|uniref:Uncharacterized protein n=1 Tax=Drosophila virilis TaxID=7244 RepID=A0A0Q9WKF3_DROVI|nr:uncharacterized protein Dvir_GJ11994 [Drosophila virilis]
MKRVARLRESTSKTEDETYEELVNCVKDHKNILQYSDILRPVISGTIFAQFLAIGLCLGLSMANLLFFSNIWTGLATFVFIFVLMIQTFPFCFICELVEDDCIGLTNAIFHSNWIGASKRYKTTLIYFLQQTQRTITFIAGGIFPICMKTNIEVIGDTGSDIWSGASRICATRCILACDAVSNGLKRSSKLQAKASALSIGDLAQVSSGSRTGNFGAACRLYRLLSFHSANLELSSAVASSSMVSVAFLFEIISSFLTLLAIRR